MPNWPQTLRSIRVHGQGSDKYDNVRLGLTGRLDTMQAAILIEKLKIFEDEIAARNKVAERYARGLGNVVDAFRASPAAAPRSGRNTPSGCPSGVDRDGFAAALKAQGIPTAIYYPKSMHQQTAYRDFPVADGGLPVERTSVRATSSACRCTPISTSRPRSGSSTLCAARWGVIRGKCDLDPIRPARTVFETVLHNTGQDDFAVLKRRRML